LDVAEGWFGQPISWKALEVCIAIAFAYPVIAGFIAWTISGTSPPQEFVHFPSEIGVVGRGTAFGGYCIYVVGLVWIGRRTSAVDQWVRRVFQDAFPTIAEVPPRWEHAIHAIVVGALGSALTMGTVALGYSDPLGYIAENIVLIIAVTPFLAFIYHISPSLLLFSAGAFCTRAYLIGFGLVGSSLVFYPLFAWFVIFVVFTDHDGTRWRVANMGYIALSGLVITWGMWVGFGVATLAHAALALGIGLPILNGAVDTISLAVSRVLGREIINHEFDRWKLSGIVVLDVTVAVALLCLLTALLAGGGEGLNWLSLAATGEPALNLDDLIGAATLDPFGEGLWVTIMLFSSLVPTAIHAAVALVAIASLRGSAARRAKWREKVDAVLEGQSEGLDPRTCRKIAEHFMWDQLLAVACFVVIFVVIDSFWGSLHLADLLVGVAEASREAVRSVLM
jgi:hypothetical protein